MDAYRQYWVECIESSFADTGITATPEQIEAVAGDVEGAHENYSMAFGTPSGPSQSEIDLEETKQQLARERNKVTCRECNGGDYYRGSLGCWKCGGKGRHAP